MKIRWEDATRAYLKFINNEIIIRNIERNPCTQHTQMLSNVYRLNLYYDTQAI